MTHAWRARKANNFKIDPRRRAATQIAHVGGRRDATLTLIRETHAPSKQRRRQGVAAVSRSSRRISRTIIANPRE